MINYYAEQKTSKTKGEYILYRLDCKECSQIKNREKSNKNVKVRHHHYVEIEGATKTVAEWSKICGVKHDVLLKRIKSGYSGTELLQKEIKTYKDITGQKFNLLTAIKRVENDKLGNARWLFACECGNEKVMNGSAVSNGHTKSCGCSLKKANTKKNLKHGHNRVGKRNKIYGVWHGMKSRCYNPNNKRYLGYGGRGILICDEWLNAYEAFYNWAINNGYSDGLTIDRIDNDKGYSPDNCRWATDSEQNRNRRNTVIVEIDGEHKTLVSCVSEYGIKYHTLWERYKRGYRGNELVRPIKK